MPLLLTERLNAERRRLFCGRQCECEQFQTAVQSVTLPFSVLHLFGSSGVGKTMLLREWMHLCQSWQVPVAYLDARSLAPTPDAFFDLLRSAMHLPATADPAQVLAAQLNRYVLLIDSYETLAPLDDWLRELFLPQISAQVLVVLAGRCPPTATWRVDPGWQTLLHAIALQNLTPEDSQLYLRQRGIPAAQHPFILNSAHGHPLTLSLLADAWMQGQKIDSCSVQPEATLNKEDLLTKVRDELSSSIHRKVLKTDTIIRLLTEALLTEVLERFTEASFARGTQQELHEPDWRTLVSTRQKRLMPQESALFSPLRNAPRLSEGPLLFSQPEFSNAVQEALRHFTRPDLLYHTPLLRSRLVLEQAAISNHSKRIEVLQDRIREATELLQQSPRDAKLYRALHHTYLSPAATQEQAAEALDLPFSTYRRHLKSGVTRVSGILWQWEVRDIVC